MPKCFIIMPITTRPELIPMYGGDSEHFQHVLDHFFVPTVKEAGFDPVLPAAEGSELIHASIISNLAAADLVLCDMSALNPNVFFELGIRTALNKPTCHIKDDVTAHVPFDTSIINYHTYASKLMPWNIQNEKDKLAAHVRKTLSSEHKGNALWRYFGVSHAAHLPTAKEGDEPRMEYRTIKLDQLSKSFERVHAELLDAKAKPPEIWRDVTPQNYNAMLLAMIARIADSGKVSRSELAQELKISRRMLEHSLRTETLPYGLDPELVISARKKFIPD